MHAGTKLSYRVVLDAQRFDLEAAKRGWKNNSQAADGIGLTASALHKLRAGKTEPQAVTIDRILSEFGLPFHTLFIRKEREQS